MSDDSHEEQPEGGTSGATWGRVDASDEWITSRRAMVDIDERHRHESEVYEEMARTMLSETSDDQLVIDSGGMPANDFVGRQLADALVEMAGPLEGRRILEPGPGTGEVAVWLAQQGAEVVAADLTRGFLEFVQRRADVNGVGDRITLVQSAMERCEEVPDESIDLIIGTNVAHHFDLPAAARSMHRMLKPGGAALFYEPVMYLPDWVFRVRRSRVFAKFMPPHIHTPDERSFDREMMRQFTEPFETVTSRYFGILGRVQNFRVISESTFHRIDKVDDWILRNVPKAETMARLVVVRMEKAR